MRRRIGFGIIEEVVHGVTRRWPELGRGRAQREREKNAGEISRK
jgi:hypothetical protein